MWLWVHVGARARRNVDAVQLLEVRVGVVVSVLQHIDMLVGLVLAELVVVLLVLVLGWVVAVELVMGLEVLLLLLPLLLLPLLLLLRVGWGSLDVHVHRASLPVHLSHRAHR